MSSACLIFTGTTTTLVMDEIPVDYPAYEEGLREGDTLLEVDGKKVRVSSKSKSKLD